MEFVGFGLAVVAVGVAVWLWQRSMTQSREAAATQARLQKESEESKKAAKSANAKAKKASDQAAQLQKDLEEALARRDEKAVTRALWNLELDRSRRQWADVIVPGIDTALTETLTTGEQLTFAISQEVERLREEVGVSIRFDGGFDADVDPEPALTTLRVAEELLALTAKLSDEVVVSLDQSDQGEASELTIVLQCVGWDDEDSSPQVLTQELANTIERLDGSLKWEELENDGLKAVLAVLAPLEISTADVD